MYCTENGRGAATQPLFKTSIFIFWERQRPCVCAKHPFRVSKETPFSIWKVKNDRKKKLFLLVFCVHLEIETRGAPLKVRYTLYVNIFHKYIYLSVICYWNGYFLSLSNLLIA